MTSNGSLWNERYSAEEFAYGKEPNLFFKSVIDRMTTGKLLVPAAGEGRDAVYAASLGWRVDAFDPSEQGKAKCERLSKEASVAVNYMVTEAYGFNPDPAGYDAIVLSYFHLPTAERKAIHLLLSDWLKPGGRIILEAFSKEQFGKTSGGPKDRDWLFSKNELAVDFSSLQIQSCEEVETVLSEGIYHRGKASVVRLTAIKPLASEQP
jgi:hypothetical protein